jgi:hypothetical protein
MTCYVTLGKVQPKLGNIGNIYETEYVMFHSVQDLKKKKKKKIRHKKGTEKA